MNAPAGTEKLLERDDALRRLDEALEQAAAGRGLLVVVSGEPGIGKTALVRAFLERAGGVARVLAGACDDLSVQRPLAPLHDLLGSVSRDLEAAIVAGERRLDVHRLLAVELDLPPRPVVLVVEDVHWADDATLDALTHVVRRLAPLPALVVLTQRAGDVPAGHALHVLLGSAPPAATVHVELRPLSPGSVAILAGADAARVHAATGGNPFYVTELVAYGGAGAVPPTVASAVRGRVSRLGPGERRLLDLVSLLPGRAPTWLLDVVLPGWASAAAEPERRQLLEVGPRSVRFRHELAREAVASAVPAATARRAHAEIVDALLAAEAAPAQLVHHAVLAGRDDVVSDHVLVAARRAAAIEANREAWAHYHRAIDFLDRHTRPEQAALLEEVAAAAQLVGRFADAIAALRQAGAVWHEVGDPRSVGRAMRLLARAHWFAGEGAPARAAAAEAVSILETFEPSRELAAAYGVLARLAMLGADLAAAQRWARRALALGASLEDDAARVNALVTLATVDVELTAETESLEEACTEATAAGLHEEAVVALGNAAYSLGAWGRPREAMSFADRAIARAEEAELHHLESYTRTLRAWLLLRAGDWSTAERIARDRTTDARSVAGLLALTVLAELAVRRGDDDAVQRLADLEERVERAGDPYRVASLLGLQVEHALTGGAAPPLERLGELSSDRLVQGQVAFRLAVTARLAGLPVQVEHPPGSPYRLVLSGDWRAAAEAFGAVGWAYDRALMLFLLDDEDALAEALQIARRLGARPLARSAAQRLRALGHSVPRGPNAATRGNAAGLTPRQAEVLALLVAGLTNAEIADRLVVSPKTAEHHVAAVLAKLGVGSRFAVARRAAELGLADA